jgi:hypothetical protein
MALDLTQLAGGFTDGISNAVKSVTGEDISSIVGFAVQQLRALAQQSALVTGLAEANAFTESERLFYLDGLKQMARSFVDTFEQIATVEIEKIYNAVISAIWQSISKLAGIPLTALTAGV